MNKSIITLTLFLLTFISCSNNESTELLEEQELFKTAFNESSAKKKKKGLVRLNIPLNTSSFHYEVKKKDKKIIVSGRLIEKLGLNPLSITYNKKTKARKLVIVNNSTDQLTVFLNSKYTYTSNTPTIGFLFNKIVYLKTGEMLIIKRKKGNNIKITLK